WPRRSCSWPATWPAASPARPSTSTAGSSRRDRETKRSEDRSEVRARTGASGSRPMTGARTNVGTVEDLHASATKAVGLDDFGVDDDNYREGLRVLLESYQRDADLTEFGSKMCRFFL